MECQAQDRTEEVIRGGEVEKTQFDGQEDVGVNTVGLTSVFSRFQDYSNANLSPAHTAKMYITKTDLFKLQKKQGLLTSRLNLKPPDHTFLSQ